MKPEELNLFYEPKERLRLTVGEEKSYLSVKPVWAAPLTHPNAYLALMNGKGEEITVVQNPQDLPSASWGAIERELQQRYLTATVARILHARQEYGATYWTVATDRGQRDFVTQSLQENAQWITDTHLLLLDVDGNRFEIPNVTLLDPPSRAYIAAIL